MKRGTKYLLKRIDRQKKIELAIGCIGLLIGMGLGLWLMIEMILLGISK